MGHWKGRTCETPGPSGYRFGASISFCANDTLCCALYMILTM